MTDSAESGDIGMLMVKFASRMIALPLASIEIQATVVDRVAGVTMQQTWHNPYDTPLEAVYIFPLPGGAAVRDFSLTTGGRRLEGAVKARGQAQTEYRTAVAAGRQAALLEQERDDVFTMQVGNIPPKETVSVALEWSERLPFFDDGSVEMRIPLVLAPRYTSPESESYMPPPISDFPPTRPLSVAVHLEDTDTPTCSHPITVEQPGMIRYQEQDAVLDRDFVLRWKLATGTLSSRGWLGPQVDGKHTAMVALLPPQEVNTLALPRDVVFLIDRSGSMDGLKMASAARAASLLLETLQPSDRFLLLAFDDRVEACFEGWLQADEMGLRRGQLDLRKITVRGGTEIGKAVAGALALLNARREASRRAGIVVLVTDGQVTDEASVFRLARKGGSGARIFTVGIDTAVNEAFLKRLASIGQGTATVVTPGDALEQAMQRVGREIGVPLVTDLNLIDVDSGVEIGSLAPCRIPDLFRGRPVTIFFRARRAGRVRLVGQTQSGKPFSTEVVIQSHGPDSLSHLWARSRVVDLEDAFNMGGDNARLEDEIVALATRYHILSRFTAFVVVDQEGPLQQRAPVREVVPVSLPAGWVSPGCIKVDLMPSEKKRPALGVWFELLLTFIRWLSRGWARLRR